MKNTVKSVTLTIEELNNIIDESYSGNIETVRNIVAAKIKEKAKRLAHQRELRRQRRQQKAEAESTANSADTNKSNRSKSNAKTVTLPLNKNLAKCILWFNSRRDALKSNLSRIVREITQSGGSSSTLASIENAINLLLQIAAESAKAAHSYLHDKYRTRATSAIVSNLGGAPATGADCGRNY